MKTKMLYLLSLFLSGALPAQKEGIVPLNQSTSNQSTNRPSVAVGLPQAMQSTNHQTRAVVVGISDYQDDAIPDLRNIFHWYEDWGTKLLNASSLITRDERQEIRRDGTKIIMQPLWEFLLSQKANV